MCLFSPLQGGLTGLYTGYFANILYAFPADATKFLIYEEFKQRVR